MTSFECKTGSIELCQCTRVTLTEAHQEYIHALYNDCLCETCLVALREKYMTDAYEDRKKQG